MEIILYIIIVNALLVIKLLWDRRAKRSGRIINHGLSAGIDGALYFIAAYILFQPFSIKFMFGIMILSAAYRWLAFDILFNFINDWKWNNYGTSSLVDRFQKKLGKFHLVPKIIALALGIFLVL